jgi:hypothetical protein
VRHSSPHLSDRGPITALPTEVTAAIADQCAPHSCGCRWGNLSRSARNNPTVRRTVLLNRPDLPPLEPRWAAHIAEPRLSAGALSLDGQMAQCVRGVSFRPRSGPQSRTKLGRKTAEDHSELKTLRAPRTLPVQSEPSSLEDCLSVRFPTLSEGAGPGDPASPRCYVSRPSAFASLR